MSGLPKKTIFYKRSHFSTHLPVDYRYTASHGWLRPGGGDRFYVGITRFAVRMLGEMVDYGFELEPGAPVEVGQIIGWIEGFKAISDIYCTAQGVFEGGNALLREEISLITTQTYGDGWIYQVQGQPDPHCVDVQGYIDVLDATIDTMLGDRREGESP